MPKKYHNPHGAEEVAATTRNKTIPKATSQLKTPGPLVGRALGPGPTAQEAFRKQVQESVADPATRKDVLKAAGLPGTGISSKPPPKPATPATPVPATPQTRTEAKRVRDMLKAAGFSAGEITVFLSKSPQARREGSTRAQMRERFLRRRAAEKYGTPP